MLHIKQKILFFVSFPLSFFFPLSQNPHIRIYSIGDALLSGWASTCTKNIYAESHVVSSFPGYGEGSRDLVGKRKQESTGRNQIPGKKTPSSLPLLSQKKERGAFSYFFCVATLGRSVGTHPIDKRQIRGEGGRESSVSYSFLRRQILRGKRRRRQSGCREKGKLGRYMREEEPQQLKEAEEETEKQEGRTFHPLVSGFNSSGSNSILHFF